MIIYLICEETKLSDSSVDGKNKIIRYDFGDYCDNLSMYFVNYSFRMDETKVYHSKELLSTICRIISINFWFKTVLFGLLEINPIKWINICYNFIGNLKFWKSFLKITHVNLVSDISNGCIIKV